MTKGPWNNGKAALGEGLGLEGGGEVGVTGEQSRANACALCFARLIPSGRGLLFVQDEDRGPLTPSLTPLSPYTHAFQAASGVKQGTKSQT